MHFGLYCLLLEKKSSITFTFAIFQANYYISVLTNLKENNQFERRNKLKFSVYENIE